MRPISRYVDREAFALGFHRRVFLRSLRVATAPIALDPTSSLTGGCFVRAGNSSFLGERLALPLLRYCEERKLSQPLSCNAHLASIFRIMLDDAADCASWRLKHTTLCCRLSCLRNPFSSIGCQRVHQHTSSEPEACALLEPFHRMVSQRESIIGPFGAAVFIAATSLPRLDSVIDILICRTIDQWIQSSIGLPSFSRKNSDYLGVGFVALVGTFEDKISWISAIPGGGIGRTCLSSWCMCRRGLCFLATFSLTSLCAR